MVKCYFFNFLANLMFHSNIHIIKLIEYSFNEVVVTNFIIANVYYINIIYEILHSLMYNPDDMHISVLNDSF